MKWAKEAYINGQEVIVFFEIDQINNEPAISNVMYKTVDVLPLINDQEYNKLLDQVLQNITI